MVETFEHLSISRLRVSFSLGFKECGHFDFVAILAERTVFGLLGFKALVGSRFCPMDSAHYVKQTRGRAASRGRGATRLINIC